MKLLTVTVPCYNSQDHMQACIDSLLAGGDRVQIIIIDDGSRDATGAIADRYAQRYPDVVEVIHQENGGHGEGINQGIRHAKGIYFKVVDSDDRVSRDFPAFLDALQACEEGGGADLVLTDYRYVHTDGIGDRTISYGNVLAPGRIVTWEQTGCFRLHQLVTLHSSTFRTRHMRAWEHGLPKHVFYEDNLMICKTLPHVQRLYYANMDLYHYTIGREGQSVSALSVKKNYRHQIMIAVECLKSCPPDAAAHKKQKACMKHTLFMMFGIAICFARLNKDRESDGAVEKMWQQCMAVNPKWARHFRYRTALWLLCIPGKVGRWITHLTYTLANKIVRYH